MAFKYYTHIPPGYYTIHFYGYGEEFPNLSTDAVFEDLVATYGSFPSNFVYDMDYDIMGAPGNFDTSVRANEYYVVYDSVGPEAVPGCISDCILWQFITDSSFPYPNWCDTETDYGGVCPNGEELGVYAGCCGWEGDIQHPCSVWPDSPQKYCGSGDSIYWAPNYYQLMFTGEGPLSFDIGNGDMNLWMCVGPDGAYRCHILTLVINGCMDPGADNYDPTATIDDGSCEYICLQPGYNIYHSDDGSDWEFISRMDFEVTGEYTTYTFTTDTYPANTPNKYFKIEKYKDCEIEKISNIVIDNPNYPVEEDYSGGGS